jgi:hypothetical protein
VVAVIQEKKGQGTKRKKEKKKKEKRTEINKKMKRQCNAINMNISQLKHL